MNSWIEKSLGEILVLNYGKGLPEKKRIKGEFPVYGSNGIVGWHNEPFVNHRGLIVGRKGSAGNVHFSSKPFCPIDTTFFVTDKDTQLNLIFLYYLLLHINLKRILGDVGVPGLNREMAYKETALFPPKKSEQQKIAHVLSKVQQAIEHQERIIQLTTELKRTLMHKIFTEGLRGEAQKQTEIGLVPDSWEVVRIGKYARVLNGYAFKSRDYISKGVWLIRISNVSDGFLINKDNKYLPENFLSEKPDFALKEGDLILSLTRPIIKTGMKYCFIEKKHLPALLNQRVGKFEIIDKKLLKEYLYHIIFSPYFVEPLKIMAEGSNQPNVSPTRLENFLMPLPTEIEEQQQIAVLITNITKKINIAKGKISSLNDLFRTLLHQLMTAQIRVHDIDLEALENMTDKE